MLSKLLKYEFRATGRIMLPVYALLLVRLKAVDEEELMAMPGGRRLVRLLRKTHLLAG